MLITIAYPDKSLMIVFVFIVTVEMCPTSDVDCNDSSQNRIMSRNGERDDQVSHDISGHVQNLLDLSFEVSLQTGETFLHSFSE